MGELELRIAALETAVIEVFAWIDPAALEDATLAIRTSLDGGDADERTIRLGALKLIEDARMRYHPGALDGSVGARSTVR